MTFESCNGEVEFVTGGVEGTTSSSVEYNDIKIDYRNLVLG